VPAIVSWGEFETGEFKRQSRVYAENLQAQGFPISAFEAADAKNFEIVFGLADRTTTLGRATLKLITGVHPE
jgi:arylformamidase